MTRICTLCKTEKSMDEFDGKTVYYCKPCRKTYRSNPKEQRAARARHLRRFFKLSLTEFEALSEKQNGRCAICGVVPSEVLRVDHSHEEGHIRGLLCDRCNVGLGAFKDNPSILMQAVKYLEAA